jgi:hypothetical protein
MSVLPVAEAILSEYLRSRPEITGLVGSRVFTELPRKEADRVFPLLKISRTGGGPTGSPAFLDRALLSVEVLGGAKYATAVLAQTVVSVVDEIAGYTALGGYATGSSPGSLRFLPDDSFEPPKPRYLLDVVVYLRSSS